MRSFQALQANFSAFFGPRLCGAVVATEQTIV
jgi:hypothetical protein